MFEQIFGWGEMAAAVAVIALIALLSREGSRSRPHSLD